MPGLNLGIGGRAGGGAQYSGSGTGLPMPPPTTPAQAAFGPGAAQPKASASSVFTPNHPFGVAFAAQIGAVIALILIRHSLPKGGK